MTPYLIGLSCFFLLMAGALTHAEASAGRHAPSLTTCVLGAIGVVLAFKAGGLL